MVLMSDWLCVCVCVFVVLLALLVKGVEEVGQVQD